MPNKGVPVNLDREGRKEHIEYHERLEVSAKQALEVIDKVETAGDYATEQGDRAKEYSDNIDLVMKDGPVQTVNGKTGQVTGLAGQADLDDVTSQLAETAKIIMSEAEPLNSDENTFWYEDKGEAPTGSDLWFEEI